MLYLLMKYIKNGLVCFAWIKSDIDDYIKWRDAKGEE